MDDRSGFKARRRWFAKVSEATAIEEGARILRNVFRERMEAPCDDHVVPLSGGLDSRLILAHLVEAGLGGRALAVTYGVPGTYDFEFARDVAAASGVRHEVIDLNRLVLCRKDLVDTHRSGAAGTELITAWYNRCARIEFGGRNVRFWSGFLGDPVAGSHFASHYPSMSFAEAVNAFMRANRWARKRNLFGLNPAAIARRWLPSEPPIADRTMMTYPEQLDFTVRQASWIEKVTCDRDTAVPFADARWIRFMLAAPAAMRKDCRLYHAIMLTTFPDLSRLKTKSVKGFRVGYPRRRCGPITSLDDRFRSLLRRLGVAWAVNRSENYLDFRHAFRHREDFIHLARNAVKGLRERGSDFGVDLRCVAEAHIAAKTDNHRELMLLISLDIAAAEGGLQAVEVPLARSAGAEIAGHLSS